MPDADRPPSTAQKGAPKPGQSSHARSARARAEAERKRRIRIMISVTASTAVIALIVVLVVVKVTSGGKSNNSASSVPPPPALCQTCAPASMLSELSSIAPATLAAARNNGSQISPPTAVTWGPPPGQGTVPEVLFMGAEYCPYCAAERWAIATALAHFGTFANVGETTSSAADTDPSTATLSFHGATYSSPYLTFSSVEETTNQPQGNGYQPLETPTAAQQAYFTANNKSGGIPFISVAGKYSVPVEYDPAILKGMTQDQIAQAIASGTGTVGQTIQAATGLFIAAICSVTGGQPGTVCQPFASS